MSNPQNPSHSLLDVQNLRVSVGEENARKEILKGLDLVIKPGEIHAIMGPNGSGKSTLSNALMGHPRYHVTGGEVLYKGKPLLDIPVDERARAGVFLAFQYPFAVPGVSVANYLRAILKSRRGADVPVKEFRKLVKEKMAMLEMEEKFLSRYVNDGFSGGEKKRHEMLQLSILEPALAILDETDSGLDIDALRIVCEGLNRVKETQPEMGVLIITHYQRMLNYIQPDVVHVLMDGRIVRSGGKELAMELEEKGYEWLEQEVFAV